MSELTREIKENAIKLGFGDVGITTPDRLRDLPHGWVADVKNLLLPEEVLPGAKSVIVLVLHAWDKAFYTQIDSPLWKGYGLHTPEENIKGYYIVYQISQVKAWPLAWLLRERGHKAIITESISMKTTAVRCGLGGQGKNTLFLHPKLGPRVGLMVILTDAVLEVDETFQEDLCGNCEKCLKACPSKALKPYNIDINRCMAYASENPGGVNVSSEVRDLADKYIQRQTRNSYLECTICMDACPIGQEAVKKLQTQ